jgi:hypothetical protein
MKPVREETAHDLRGIPATNKMLSKDAKQEIEAILAGQHTDRSTTT